MGLRCNQVVSMTLCIAFSSKLHRLCLPVLHCSPQAYLRAKHVLRTQRRLRVKVPVNGTNSSGLDSIIPSNFLSV